MRRNIKRRKVLIIIFGVLVALLVLARYLPVVFRQDISALPSLKIDDIETVIVSIEGEKSELFKEDGRWFVKGRGERPDAPANGQRIDSLLDALSLLDKEEVISKSKKKYKTFEVDGKRKIVLHPKKARVSLNKKQDEYIVFIGKGHALSGVYFRLAADPNVYIASQDIARLLQPPDFRDLAVNLIADETAVSKIKVDWGGEVVVLLKKNDAWKINEEVKAKQERVDFFINDIATLEGDDVLDKDSIDIKKRTADLKLVIWEDAAEKGGFFYKHDERGYFFLKSGSQFIYHIPQPRVETLKKTEEDFTE